MYNVLGCWDGYRIQFSGIVRVVGCVFSFFSAVVLGVASTPEVETRLGLVAVENNRLVDVIVYLISRMWNVLLVKPPDI